MLIGTLIGHQGGAYRGPENPEIVSRILAWAHIDRGDGVSKDGGSRLLKRKRMTEKAEAWFFTNPHEIAVRESVDVAGFTKVEDLLGSTFERRGDTVTLDVESLDVQVLILTK